MNTHKLSYFDEKKEKNIQLIITNNKNDPSVLDKIKFKKTTKTGQRKVQMG
jgi:hypothetical protein